MRRLAIDYVSYSTQYTIPPSHHIQNIRLLDNSVVTYPVHGREINFKEETFCIKYTRLPKHLKVSTQNVYII